MNTSPLGTGYPALASNGGSAGTRFVPHNFQYNVRVALALLPSLAVLAGYGGNAVAAALAVRRLAAAPQSAAALLLSIQPSAAAMTLSSSSCMPTMHFMQRQKPLPLPCCTGLASHRSAATLPVNLPPRHSLRPCAALSPLLQLGLMATYILDALRYKEGAFMSAW